jgi:class 3 adenylate cyclase
VPACPSCGHDNEDHANFCLTCGTRLATPVSVERFRKTVTVIFSDVIGSTTLGEQLDPETLSHVMSDYFQAMKPVIERHGGQVAKFVGDAVMAVFGLPTLHEDERCGLCAARARCERPWQS